MFPQSQVEEEEHMPEASNGILYPPRDMRTVMDKTAFLVARWGPEREKRVITTYAGRPYFGFLDGSDPYHAYYQHRVLESQFQLLKLAEAPAEDCPGILNPAEAEQYKKWLPEGITGEDLEIVKRYARGVARYGASYVARTIDKPRCEILEEISDSTIMFVKTLAAAYWKVLTAPEWLLEKMKPSRAALMPLLERELHHLELERSQEKAMSHNNDSDPAAH